MLRGKSKSQLLPGSDDEENVKMKIGSPKLSRAGTAKSTVSDTKEVWNGVCLDDGTGRNVAFHDFGTGKKTRYPPENYVEERFENGNRRFYYRGQCIRCRTPSPCVFFTIESGKYGVSTNYCEPCLLTVTLGIKSIRRNGDLIWEENSDIPCNTFLNLKTMLLHPDREEILLQRAKEASFAVKTTAKHYRNLDRIRNMKILALQQEIYDGKMVSWGFGKQFDEYYGPVDSFNRPHGEKGMKIYSDGSIYIGGWSKGLRHHIDGVAIWTRPDNSQYEGTWMNDLKHGTGRQRYPDNSIYAGEFAQGFEHGNGIRYNADGTRFEGRFRFGKRDGQGAIYHPNGSIDKGIFKDTECFHEPLLPKIEEEDEPDGTQIIFQPDSLLKIATRAVANTMKIKRSYVSNTRILNTLQPFLKSFISKEYLLILNPIGSKDFIDQVPLIAFQLLDKIILNYVKFLNFDMESFLYFTTMNSSLISLELMNNRIDPTSMDLLNKQIANPLIWPHLQYINLSFNKIDTTGISNLMKALQIGGKRVKVIKLSGCNINSTGAIPISKYIEETEILEELDISFNSIQAAGAESIANALMKNKSLRSVNLRQNNIGVIGGECLVKAMQSNFQIKVLCVADNKISRDVSIAIAGRLRGSTKDVIESFRANQLTIPSIHLEKAKRIFH